MIHKTLALFGALLFLLSLGLTARADEPVANLNHQATITTVQTFIDKDGVAWKVTTVEVRTVTYEKVTVTPDPVPTSPPTTPTTPTPTPVTPPITTSPITAYRDVNNQSVTAVKTGDKITIVGSGFGAPAPGGNRVALNGTAAPIQSWTDTLIVVTIPTIAPTPTTVAVKLFSLASAASSWTLVATGPNLTVNP